MSRLIKFKPTCFKCVSRVTYITSTTNVFMFVFRILTRSFNCAVLVFTHITLKTLSRHDTLTQITRSSLLPLASYNGKDGKDIDLVHADMTE